MIESLKKLSNEGIEVSINTIINGMIQIKLTHKDNHSSYFISLEELIQLNSPDDAFIELLYCTYDELKKFEAKQNDL